MKTNLIFRPSWSSYRALFLSTSLVVSAVLGGTFTTVFADTYHVWEKVEIALHAEKSYKNPYKETEVWVDLKGPRFNKRCYGFWDGDDTFRVRVMATAPGTWTWSSGSNQSDPGLNGVTGTFSALGWAEPEKEQNPCRRGMVRPSANGHAFEYADGTVFFLLGDTWWPTGTFRYRWHDDDRQRPIGPKAGFKDYVRFRKKQGYNCIAMIAAFPHWANDGKPVEWETEDGMQLRDGWQLAGTNSVKDMHDEEGNRPFHFPGKVPGYENYIPDLDRINPAYFQSLDKKIDYLNANGFIPFIEVARRDIGPIWKKYHQWPESYTRYIQYVWSRYQANICFFSPIHLDWAGSLPPADWNLAANKVIEKYGPPPFGTLAGTNSNPSSLHNFGHIDQAKWLTFHQIGNQRTHNNYAELTEIFNTVPFVPGLHGEPYYAGMAGAAGHTETSALYCRSGMYGSVLSGGLAGHIYGAGGWEGGMWAGDVEEAAKTRIWDAIKWPSGGQMQHLKTFVFSERRKYQNLVPLVELISPNKSGPEKGYIGWAYCARTPSKDFFLIYFEKDCPQASLSGALPNAKYKATWFNPRSSQWTDAGDGVLIADSTGKIVLPNFPGNLTKSDLDWGLKLTLMDVQ